MTAAETFRRALALALALYASAGATVLTATQPKEVTMKVLLWVSVLTATAWIVWKEVLPRLRDPARIADLERRLAEAGDSIWARFWVRVDSWKTVILGFAGTALTAGAQLMTDLAPYLPDVITQLQAAPWAEWLDAGVAKAIACALYLAMILTRLRATLQVGKATPTVEEPK